MKIYSVKTERIKFGESLRSFLNKYISKLNDTDIIVITSKILSIIEGSFVDKKSIDKIDLIKKEADYFIESDYNPYDIYLTIKNGILIPSAGIDESNVKDVYVLYPKNIQETTNFIWQYLREKFEIKNLGVIITDSHTTIMRRGVTGIALSYCGFLPLFSYINKPDIYGQKLKATQINILDSLASSSVFVMGEGDEQTPIAIIEDAPKISFLDRVPTKKEIKSIKISPKDDLYYPILRSISLD